MGRWRSSYADPGLYLVRDTCACAPYFVTLMQRFTHKEYPVIMTAESMKLSSDGTLRLLTMQGSGAFNPDSLAAFNAALDAVLTDESAEILLITGVDKNFSQGLDLDYLMSAPEGAMDFVRDCLLMIGRLLTFPVPVVSAVNGHAFGLGAMITLASDYKVMRQDRGYFCLPEVDLGMTLTYRMNALVCGKLSGNVLRDILLTGRRVAGPEAAQWGIVDGVAPEAELLALAQALAAPMRGKNRNALAGLKRGINLDILAVIEADDADTTIPGVQS